MKKLFFLGLAAIPFFAAAQQTNEQTALPPGEHAQNNINLSGVVLDERTRSPLPGATVQIKGTTHEVITDHLGTFRFLTGQKLPVTYIISYVGYEKKEVYAESRSINITLKETSAALSDVVVLGYGTQKRTDVTGSVALVSKTALSQPAVAFDNLLQGAVSGVSVTQSSGQPGTTATVRIRGGNSISFGNDPLYVIDGFIVYNNNSYTNPGAAGGSTINALSTINPSDIESIEVLKDASATAIYGARGANGVVLITTRRGRKNADEISYNGYYGVQNESRKLPLLNGSQWASLVNDINVADGVPKTYSDSAITAFGKGYDWQSAALRSAAIQNHELSVSGGDEKSRYLVSGNYFNQDGVVVNTGFRRFSGRVNYERNLTERLKVSANVFTSYSTENQPPTTAFNGANLGPLYSTTLQTVPIVPIYNEDGTYNTNNPYLSTPTNALQDLYIITNKSLITRTLGNLAVDFKIFRDLRLRITGGADLLNTKQDYYAPSNSSLGYTAGGYGSVGTVAANNWQNENTLTYDHVFNDAHFLTVLAGYTTQSGKDESAIAQSQKFPNDLTQYNSLGSASTALLASSNAHSWSLNSWLGRISYSYLHKYNLTASLRADGASVLGAHNKWGYFPSIGVSWNISQEEFLKDITAISNLKLRLSAGQTGNSNVPPYSSLATLSPVGYYLGNPLSLVTGIVPTQLANPDLKWETTTQYNAGIDVSLWKNRINLTADVYYKKTTDLLLNVPLPVYTGYASALENVGSLENKGFEIALNTDNIRTKNFSWKSSIVFARNLNKILNLGPGVPSYFPTAPIGQQSPVIVSVGLPVATFWGYSTNGLLTADDIAKGVPLLTGVPQQVGDQKYVALDGHTSVTTADKHNLGNAQPSFTYGFSNNLAFENFDLSFIFQGSYGNKIYNQFEQTLEKPTLALNASAVLNDRWTPTHTDATVPRATNSPVPQIIDKYIENGSYLRLKNITLGYTLAHDLSSKIAIRQIRVYVSAQNLFTVTKYTGLDPEVNYYDSDNTKQGIDYGQYPTARTFLVGLNLTF